MKIELDGVEEAKREFERLDATLKPKFLDQLQQKGFDFAFKEVDTHTRTGQLLRSLKQKRSASQREIYHNLREAHYASYVHWGTGAHQITPKSKKWLRWPSGAGGSTKFFFAKKVRHPGYKGDPWFAHTADHLQKIFPSLIRRFDSTWR